MRVKDLKVLELASVLAGPSVGSFFAELGAHVLKIENPLLKGDVTRKWKQSGERPQTKISAYYAAANTYKKIKYLNFLIPSDRQSLDIEIINCDILIVNFKPGDAKKFSLTFEDCKKLNSKLIYAEITGYGPDSKRSAFDMVLQAETGFLSINGAKEEPAKLPVAFIDLFAAHQLKSGILVALLEEKAPCKVSVSLFDAAIASLANQATNQIMNEKTPIRMGTLHPNIAPYGEIVTSSDGTSFVLAVGSNAQFEKLLDILKIENRKEFITNTLRVKNRIDLLNILQNEIAKINSSDFCTKCSKLGVPIGKIQNLKEVFDSREAQNLIIEEVQEGEETKKVKTAVFVISS